MLYQHKITKYYFVKVNIERELIFIVNFNLVSKKLYCICVLASLARFIIFESY